MERCSDDRSSWSLYTSKVDLVLHEIPPGAKKPLVFSYASITPIDLIQLNNWILGIFMNLIQRKPDLKLFYSLPFYWNNDSSIHG